MEPAQRSKRILGIRLLRCAPPRRLSRRSSTKDAWFGKRFWVIQGTNSHEGGLALGRIVAKVVGAVSKGMPMHTGNRWCSSTV